MLEVCGNDFAVPNPSHSNEVIPIPVPMTALHSHSHFPIATILIPSHPNSHLWLFFVIIYSGNQRTLKLVMYNMIQSLSLVME